MNADRSKIWCCKEKYWIGTWNIRSLNQGKLKVVKQEMTRVNVNILGISTLRWTGMGEFNSDDHCIYSCGQESLRKKGVAITVNKIFWQNPPKIKKKLKKEKKNKIYNIKKKKKSLKCSTWMQSQKWQNDLCSFPRQAIQYQSNLSQCPNQ